MKVDVSIIIVNYKSSKLVIDCVNSIFEKTKKLSYEIIVVDNASNDDSIDNLKKEFGDEIKLIQSEENLGFGKANNLGVKSSCGKYIFMLNPDTILINNAIYILMNILERNKDIGSVGGNLYTIEMEPCPSYCRKFDDLNTERMYSSWMYILFNKVVQKINSKRKNNNRALKNNFNYSGKSLEVAYIFGADMMMRKSLFEQIGGFDPIYFMYAEEQDLSWRITNKGKKNISIPEAKIIHLEGGTFKEINKFSDSQFKMRMNGIMIYFNKRFGIDGVDKFYKYRTRRYNRLIKFAKLRGKNVSDLVLNKQLNLLRETYFEYIKNYDKEIGYGRS